MKRIVIFVLSAIMLPLSVVMAQSAGGMISGHEYVDLGLSVKWATCNVGASTPSDYGDYYAWGETSTKAEYTKDNSKTIGKNIGDIAGNSTFDVARAEWGGKWRMPTKSELEELKAQCTWTWTTQGGHDGYKVTGKNGNSIFLPAAGWRYETSLYDAGDYGSLWCSTPYENGTNDAYGICFESSYHSEFWGFRDRAFSVRPVAE